MISEPLPPPNAQNGQYQLFILRVWQETSDGPRRYMLKRADNHERYVFADSNSLADFLAQNPLYIKEDVQ